MTKWVNLTAAAVAALGLAAPGCKRKTKEELLQAAEDKSRFETEKVARQAEGIGEGLQGAGKKGAESLSKGVGDVFRGTAQGFDASLAAVTVKPGAGLAEAGLQIDRAARRPGEAPTITAYVVGGKPFAGTLLLRALDDAGREVGRARAEVEQDADEAGYVDFAFDPRAPLTAVTTFEISVREAREWKPTRPKGGR
jgi:hypothetical protein